MTKEEESAIFGTCCAPGIKAVFWDDLRRKTLGSVGAQEEMSEEDKEESDPMSCAFPKSEAGEFE